MVTKDEEYTRFNEAKFGNLRAVFKKDGTVTAGNASTLNDGACAMILMSAEKVFVVKYKFLKLFNIFVLIINLETSIMQLFDHFERPKN